MSIFRGSVYAASLCSETDLTVLLPYDSAGDAPQTPCRVVYLLHGLGGNQDCWTRYTAVERYARSYGVAVVMPNAYRSFYTDMRYGRPVFQYITEELPQLVSGLFRVSTRREDSFIAGQSMGGYGCLKCALSCPERYAAVGAISGVTDFRRRFPIDKSDYTRAADMQQIFGEEPVCAPQDDLFVLARRVAALPGERQPRIFTCCGTEDFLYDHNRRFRELAQSLPLDYRYEEWPGVHDWAFFDAAIQRVLAFFFA